MTMVNERCKMQPVALVCDIFGLPQVLDVLPMRADIATDWGIVIPKDLLCPVLENAKSKVKTIRRF